MKNNFLSRITRRKGPTPVEAGEEGYELPPPSVIEPGVPYAAQDTPDSDYDSHRELELLASNEPTRTDSTNGAEAQESDAAPVLESLTAPVKDDSPDELGPSTEAPPYEEYGLDIELITEPESNASSDEDEPPREDEESVLFVPGSVATATESEILQKDEPEDAVDEVFEYEGVNSGIVKRAGEGSLHEPEITQESESEAADFAASENEEIPATSVVEDAPEATSNAALYEEYDLDIESLTESESEAFASVVKAPAPEPEVLHASEPEAAADAVAEASMPEPEMPQEIEPEAVDELVQEEEPPVAAVSQESPDTDEFAPKSNAALYEEYDLDIESLTESESDDSPGEAEPPDEQDEAVSVVEESVVEATESDPVVPQESELEAVEDVSPEEEMRPAESVLQNSPEESPEPSRAETGISPHVRDARGRLRPGKGFSRSELREAGLSLADAARLNIRVDKRRRNVHPVNVAALEKAKSGV